MMNRLGQLPLFGAYTISAFHHLLFLKESECLQNRVCHDKYW